MSPVTILAPSKPRFIISRVVGIEIDVQTGYPRLHGKDQGRLDVLDPLS